MMHRYRVHIVPRTGRYAPLLTVLVEAGSRDEALQIAQLRNATSKAISAEDVGASPVRAAGLRLLVGVDGDPALGAWSACGAASNA